MSPPWVGGPKPKVAARYRTYFPNMALIAPEKPA
jgi:hypothetical protein